MRPTVPEGQSARELRRAASEAEQEQLASMPGMVKAGRLLLMVQLFLGAVTLLLLLLADGPSRSYGSGESSAALLWTAVLLSAWLVAVGWCVNALSTARRGTRAVILVLEAVAMLTIICGLFTGGAKDGSAMLALGLAFAVSMCLGSQEAAAYFEG